MRINITKGRNIWQDTFYQSDPASKTFEAQSRKFDRVPTQSDPAQLVFGDSKHERRSREVYLFKKKPSRTLLEILSVRHSQYAFTLKGKTFTYRTHINDIPPHSTSWCLRLWKSATPVIWTIPTTYTALHLNLQCVTVRTNLDISTGMVFRTKTCQIYASEPWESM
jgi:hypothetical protein